MYRLLLTLLVLAVLASLGANLFEFGGATLHPRHGERLEDAAARDRFLVQTYAATGRVVLPALKLDRRALETAERIYGAAFALLDRHPSAVDERSFTDMVKAPGVYRPAWRVASFWATPVLLVLLLVAWLFRPRVVHMLPQHR